MYQKWVEEISSYYFFFVGWNWINFDHLKQEIILTWTYKKKKVEILEKEKNLITIVSKIVWTT